MSLDNKVCDTCGRTHAEIPVTARFQMEGKLAGFYWECPCTSTLFVPVRKVVARIRQEKLNALKNKDR